MDRQAAVKIIKDTFEKSFDQGRFIYFSKNLVNYLDTSKNFTYQGNIIPDAYERSIQSLERIGKYEGADGNKIDVLIVRLKKEYSLERARTMQRNFVAWYLNGSRGGDLKDAALAAFVSPGDRDWRFSLVRMDYNIVESPSGKIKVETELTPARRYSFIVGENESSHTAQRQLLDILEDDKNSPSLADLGSAFSIEVVTREFFEKYRGLFLDIKDALESIVKKDEKIRDDFTSKAVNTVDFSKKLLGQIVFLYFLQKKGWFGVDRDADWGTGSKNFLRLLFEKQIVIYQNFFNDILEPLFYEVLASERQHDFYSRFNCKIPFLNGGLFAPINDYDWVHTDILLPNELFSNTQKTREGDVGTGILDVFDRYNFTVREDEPLEKEIAIDPEMLGKVFEKLCGVNDENFVEWAKAIKSKVRTQENKFNRRYGVYYTPREIVHYMCQESLINYLDTAINTTEVPLAQVCPPQGKLSGKPDPEQTTFKTPSYSVLVPREDIETFVRMGELAIEHDSRVKSHGKETERYSYRTPRTPESIRQNAKLIDEKLASIRVCDPAIGSGAFPVGLMAEIVRARNTLTTYLANKEARTDYSFKRDCIQDCLYGVDIDPGAVEIAKLRLWLSLVVDEEDIKQIKPLPNLDYKIMQGNSLIDEFHGISLVPVGEGKSNMRLFGKDDELDRLVEDLQVRQYAFFNATHAGEKEQRREQVENAIVDIFRYELKRQQSGYFHELGQIEQKASHLPKAEDRQKYYEALKAKLDKKYDFDFEAMENELREMTHGNKVRPFFPWELYFADVFRQKGGFDVVIANPPYDVLNITEGHRISKRELAAFREAPMYKVALGGKLNLFRLFFAKAFHLLKESGIVTYIIPYSFMCDSSSKSIRQFILREKQIVFIEAFPERDDPHKRLFESVKMSTCIICVRNCNERESFPVRIHNAQYVSFDVPTVHLDSHTIESLDHNYLSIPLTNDYNLGIAIKIQGNNRTKIGDIGKCYQGEVNLTFHKKCLRKTGDSNVPLIKGAAIQRFLVLRRMSQGEIQFVDPLAFAKHNDSPKSKHHRCRRIIMQGITGVNEKQRLKATIIDRGVFCAHSVNYILLKDNGYSLSYILTILNSKLMNWYFKLFSTNSNVNSYEVENFPIPTTDQKPLIDLADSILSITKDDDYLTNPAKKAKVRDYERQIDQLVYQLYSLTPEEIAAVEGFNTE